MRRAYWLIALAILPVSVYANAGTPLMWVSFLHLVFGNALIGWGEGAFISRICRVSAKRCVPTMIVANYFSAWFGGLFLTAFLTRHVDVNLYNGWRWFWWMAVFTFIFTVILEWPFVAFCLRKKPRWIQRSLTANLAAQALSYTLLFGWYWIASPKSLFTDLTVVPASKNPGGSNTGIYFISAKDGDVYSSDLSGLEIQHLCRFGSTNENDRLFTQTNSTSTWNLLVLCTDGVNSTASRLLLSNMVGQALDERPKRDDIRSTWRNWGPVPKLGRTNDWQLRTGFWPATGIIVESADPAKSKHFAFETPFIAWNIRNATQLPDDRVVFQLGTDQICLFDPKRKQIALIVRGRGPAVALAQPLID